MAHTERIWLSLLLLTGLGAWLGETAHAGWLLTVVVSALIFLKGHLIIDYFIEARTADRRIRRTLYTFLASLSVMVLLSQTWGQLIATHLAL